MSQLTIRDPRSGEVLARFDETTGEEEITEAGQKTGLKKGKKRVRKNRDPKEEERDDA